MFIPIKSTNLFIYLAYKGANYAT